MHRRHRDNAGASVVVLTFALAAPGLHAQSGGTTDQTCQEKVGPTAFAKPSGTAGVIHCYVPSDSGGEPIYMSAVFVDTGPAAPADSKPGPSAESEQCGLDQGEIEAAKKFFGRTFRSIPEVGFEKHWRGALRQNEAATATAAPDPAPQSLKAEIRGYFNGTRDRFWAAVYDDKNGPARTTIEQAGFEFTKRGNSPRIVVTNPDTGEKIERNLDVDHEYRLTDCPRRALDTANLRLIFPRENRCTLEQIRKKDPFQAHVAKCF